MLDADAAELRRKVVQGPPRRGAHEATRLVGPIALEGGIGLLEDHALALLVEREVGPSTELEHHDRLIGVCLVRLAQRATRVRAGILAVEDALVHRESRDVERYLGLVRRLPAVRGLAGEPGAIDG